MKIEEWRPVVGFEGLYEVSDFGRVRSIDRMLPWKRVIKGVAMDGLRLHRGRFLVEQEKEAGHLWVSLGRGERHYIHHLVLKAFVGPAPEGTECCHWDDDPSNNRLENLRWDTRAANLADFERNHGRRQCESSYA